MFSTTGPLRGRTVKYHDRFTVCPDTIGTRVATEVSHKNI